MEITFKVSDGLAWVRWRSRAGHIEDGHFVVDDEPGERTGPWGKTHAASGDGRTVCGKSVEAECEEVPEDEVSAQTICRLCLKTVTL